MPAEAGGATLVDAVLSVRHKGAASGTVRVGAKRRVEPKDVDYLAAALQPTPDQPALTVDLKIDGDGNGDLRCILNCD